jgi:hypothetical protein
MHGIERDPWATIVTLLEDAAGPDHAVTIAFLAQVLGVPRRTIETLIETNLHTLPFCIVSGAAGLYRPTSPEDVNRYLQSLQSRIKCLAIRSRTVRTLARADGYEFSRNRAEPVAPQASAWQKGLLFDLPSTPSFH